MTKTITLLLQRIFGFYIILNIHIYGFAVYINIYFLEIYCISLILHNYMRIMLENKYIKINLIY